MNEQIHQLILGSLFGDGYLTRSPNSIAFHEGHSIKQKEYLLWKKHLFSQVTEKIGIYETSKTKAIHIRVSSLPELNLYYENFYHSHGRKSFNLAMLRKLDPFGMAIWFMDDGSYNKPGNYCFFSMEEKNTEIVCAYFKEYFGFNAKIYTRNGSKSSKVILNAQDTRIFFDIVRSFIHQSMIYKIEKTPEEIEEIKRYQRNQANIQYSIHKEKIKNRNRNYYHIKKMKGGLKEK